MKFLYVVNVNFGVFLVDEYKCINEDVIIRWLKRKGIIVDSCDSCWNDEWNGYDSTSIYYLYKNRYSQVSCGVSSELSKLGLKEK